MKYLTFTNTPLILPSEGNSGPVSSGSELLGIDSPLGINYISLLGAFAGTITALVAVALVAVLSVKVSLVIDCNYDNKIKVKQ